MQLPDVPMMFMYDRPRDFVPRAPPPPPLTQPPLPQQTCDRARRSRAGAHRDPQGG